jgi:hypothetical protein
LLHAIKLIVGFDCFNVAKNVMYKIIKTASLFNANVVCCDASSPVDHTVALDGGMGPPSPE